MKTKLFFFSLMMMLFFSIKSQTITFISCDSIYPGHNSAKFNLLTSSSDTNIDYVEGVIPMYLLRDTLFNPAPSTNYLIDMSYVGSSSMQVFFAKTVGSNTTLIYQGTITCPSHPVGVEEYHEESDMSFLVKDNSLIVMGRSLDFGVTIYDTRGSVVHTEYTEIDGFDVYYTERLSSGIYIILNELTGDVKKVCACE